MMKPSLFLNHQESQVLCSKRT